MIKPIFSIIIPTFQRVQLLERAILSVLGQQFKDWELLIVDDGSTDSTQDLVKVWGEKDSRIKFFKRPYSRSKGPSSCRNIGMELAKGEYLAFLDSDDEWLPKRLNRALDYMEQNQAKAIYSGALVKGQKTDYMRPSRQLTQQDSVFDFILNPRTFTQTSTLIIHRDIARKVSFPETMTHHEDYDFFIQVSRIALWHYFDNYDVVVHWEDNSKRKINYRNCLDFYKNYRQESKDKEGRIRYLSYMSEDLVKRKGGGKYLKEYQLLLKEENPEFSLRKRLLFFSPILFRLFLRLRNIVRN